MKKVKVMLSALAVLAVVGGTLAFKAQKLPQFCRYKIVGNICPLLDKPFQTQFVGAGDQTVIPIPATGCPTTTSITDCNQSFFTVLD